MLPQTLSRLLIVKTSSMGDVIHNLPVISDIQRAFPDLVIDWVVEEAFADLPRLHPAVNKIIPVALRRWRKSWFAPDTRRERAAFRANLRAEAYDLVLDTQGLIKSALIARIACLTRGTNERGQRAGFGRRSAREPLASLFYHRHYEVNMKQHAIERVRSLAAQALGYQVEGGPQFNLMVEPNDFPWLPVTPYAVLLHATSRAEKQWPAANWKELVQQLTRMNITPVLVWGSPKECEMARYLAADCASAVVARQLSLAQAASLIAGASVVVGVDTGLTHLAAALNVRTVAIFGATPRWRFAPYWSTLAMSLGENNIQPPLSEVVTALHQLMDVS